MIMPCINSTSPGESGSNFAVVDAGSLLLGCPGAPGCTITGPDDLSLCWVCADVTRKPPAAPAKSPKPKPKLEKTAANIVHSRLPFRANTRQFVSLLIMFIGNGLNSVTEYYHFRRLR